LYLRLSNPEQRSEVERLLSNDFKVPAYLKSDPAELTVRISNPNHVIHVLSELARLNIQVISFSFGQPSLDEVFLALTGHQTTNGDSEESV